MLLLIFYPIFATPFDRIRKATNGNFALGSEKFAKEISETLGRRVTPGKASRPRKE